MSAAERREAMRRQEDDDRAARYEELRVRDECESVDAMETYWQGVMEQRPSWIADTIYELDRG